MIQKMIAAFSHRDLPGHEALGHQDITQWLRWGFGTWVKAWLLPLFSCVISPLWTSVSPCMKRIWCWDLAYKGSFSMSGMLHTQHLAQDKSQNICKRVIILSVKLHCYRIHTESSDGLSVKGTRSEYLCWEDRLPQGQWCGSKMLGPWALKVR